MLLDSCIDARPAVSDEVLAASAREGARDALAALFARHQDRVYRLALRMCRNPDDAEEVVQETFFLAHRGVASFHGESRFATWLCRIAINQVLMRRRSARRRPAQSLELASPDVFATTAAGSEPPETADELIDRKMLTQRVRQALAQLDESHRSALVLRDLEELSSEQTAEILGVSADAVRQRVHRARVRLREALVESIRVSARAEAAASRW